jgi:hypothetical protein
MPGPLRTADRTSMQVVRRKLRQPQGLRRGPRCRRPILSDLHVAFRQRFPTIWGYLPAVAAYNALCSANAIPSLEGLAALWLGGVCRTASHELGHCFGIDHCVYCACAMQGSASLAEDARQPIYFCPLDLAKLLHATGADMVDHYLYSAPNIL